MTAETLFLIDGSVLTTGFENGEMFAELTDAEESHSYRLVLDIGQLVHLLQATVASVSPVAELPSDLLLLFWALDGYTRKTRG